MKKLLVSALFGVFAVACGGSGGDEVATGEGAATARTPEVPNLGADKATRCHGTEPFWGITIDRTSVQYKSADGATRTIETRGAQSAIGTTASFAALYQGKVKEESGRFLNVIITQAGAGGCSDGMSDESFPFNVSVLSGNELLIGCCR